MYLYAELNLTAPTLYQNAYEVLSDVSAGDQCGPVCCSGGTQQISLEYNVTNYIVYTVYPVPEYTFELSISVIAEPEPAASVAIQPWQAINTETGVFYSSVSSSGATGVNASVTLAHVNQENYGILYSTAPNYGFAFFLIQTSEEDEGRHQAFWRWQLLPLCLLHPLNGMHQGSCMVGFVCVVAIID